MRRPSLDSTKISASQNVLKRLQTIPEQVDDFEESKESVEIKESDSDTVNKPVSHV